MLGLVAEVIRAVGPHRLHPQYPLFMMIAAHRFEGVPEEENPEGREASDAESDDSDND